MRSLNKDSKYIATIPSIAMGRIWIRIFDGNLVEWSKFTKI